MKIKFAIARYKLKHEIPSMKYLRRMNNLYNHRLKKYSTTYGIKHAMEKPESVAKTFLRVLGVLPIERPHKTLNIVR